MREKDVGRLVDSWSQILNQVSEQKISTDIGNLCIEVVGQYVEWIDINLVSYFNLLMGETVIDVLKSTNFKNEISASPHKNQLAISEK